jgi:hypothetical protein
MTIRFFIYINIYRYLFPCQRLFFSFYSFLETFPVIIPFSHLEYVTKEAEERKEKKKKGKKRGV